MARKRMSVLCNILLFIMWTGITQSVKRLDTGLTFRESNSRGGEIFRTCSVRPCGAPSLLYNGTVSFPGLKWPGLGVEHPTLPITDVKEKVELYIYSPSGSSWVFYGELYLLPLPLLFAMY
jgi:hypothetical protein